MTHEPQPVFNLYEPSDDRRNVVDCVQQFCPQSFDHVDHLETLEIQASERIQ